MSKKRDRLEIIHDILEVVREKGGNVKPTHILYKSNLSHEMLQKYLSDLIGKGFIDKLEDKKGKKSYSLTNRGFKYLKDYEVIKGFVDSYDLA